MARAARKQEPVRETVYWMKLSEGDMIDLVSGYVPSAVVGRALGQLDARRNDERRAARPVKEQP